MHDNFKDKLIVLKVKLKKKFKNKFFRRRLVLYFICLLIFILIMSLILKNAKRKKYENQVKTYEANVFGTLEEDYAQITKYYTYGTHLHLEGTIDNINKDNYESVSILVSDEHDTREYGINGSLSNSTLTFSSANQLNSGIYIDEFNDGTYYIKVKVKMNNSNKPKLYTLKNNSSYPAIDYYSVTREGKNKLAKINFTSYTNFEKRKFDCLSMKISDTQLPAEVYDIVIDAGHGGTDAGVSTGGYLEKNIMLDYAKALKTSIESHGFKVKLTRDDSNTDSYTDSNMYDLDGRVTVACGTKAKLLLALHIADGSARLTGCEVYAPPKGDLYLARSMANNMKSSTTIPFSNNNDFRETDGVYLRNYTNPQIEVLTKTAQAKGYDPYNITTQTPYYYMIRETGGIATGAYMDGRNTAYNKNIYYDSNQGIESYLINFGYIRTDLQVILEQKNGFIDAITQSIVNDWK